MFKGVKHDQVFSYQPIGLTTSVKNRYIKSLFSKKKKNCIVYFVTMVQTYMCFLKLQTIFWLASQMDDPKRPKTNRKTHEEKFSVISCFDRR